VWQQAPAIRRCSGVDPGARGLRADNAECSTTGMSGSSTPGPPAFRSELVQEVTRASSGTGKTVAQQGGHELCGDWTCGTRAIPPSMASSRTPRKRGATRSLGSSPTRRRRWSVGRGPRLPLRCRRAGACGYARREIPRLTPCAGPAVDVVATRLDTRRLSRAPRLRRRSAKPFGRRSGAGSCGTRRSRRCRSSQRGG
jgi:hypothetical protein